MTRGFAENPIKTLVCYFRFESVLGLKEVDFGLQALSLRLL